MGTHLIPREVDGDARILLVFTPKGFIGVLIGIGIGAMFYGLASAFNATIVGWVLLALCALIGFVVGQVKLPESNSFGILKKIGGEYVKDVILSYLRFRKNKKIYLYDKTDYNKIEENEKISK